jgi:hypothetical protein
MSILLCWILLFSISLPPYSVWHLSSLGFWTLIFLWGGVVSPTFNPLSGGPKFDFGVYSPRGVGFTMPKETPCPINVGQTSSGDSVEANLAWETLPVAHYHQHSPRLHWSTQSSPPCTKGAFEKVVSPREDVFMQLLDMYISFRLF